MTALVLGATGLVGNELVDQLLSHPAFDRVKIFVRRSAGKRHEKLEEHIIDFDAPASWNHLVKGDVLFSALGTTLKTAGSREAQYRVDHTYQYLFAKAAAENGVPVYVLVSSAMANPDSRLFYTRIKGELERDISQLPFSFIHILQPGMLTGNRKEHRAGEKAGRTLIEFLNRLGIARKQRPVPAATVARAMINLSQEKLKRVETTSLLDVFRAAE